jgi:hypothetical protein
MKLWASRRTETEDDAERPAAVEALGTKTIAPYGEASARAEEEDISRRRGGELTAARGRTRGGSADGLRGGGCGGALGSDTKLEKCFRVSRGKASPHLF